MLGVIRKKGVYVARMRVPQHLREAVGRLCEPPRERLSWLQRSLGTKELKRANVAAKSVMMEFDRIIAKAAASLVAHPILTALPDKQTKLILGNWHAERLSEGDERTASGDPEGQAVYARVWRDVEAAGFPVPALEKTPERGLTERQMRQQGETLAIVLPTAEAALARGDSSFEVAEIDYLAPLNLDRKNPAFGMAVLKQDVQTLRELALRQVGQGGDTPPILDDPQESGEEAAPGGETLRSALKGWEKAKSPSPHTLHEFRYSVERFIELHGDMLVAKIARRHVLQFREALQDMPRGRAGALRKATLPELVKWAKHHPEAERVANPTVNKLLSGVQAVSVWGRDNGFIPDDVQWADPFSNMRLEVRAPEREPWQVAELNTLFASSVFKHGKRPAASGGEAAYWLPLLGLFTGARLGELAPLQTADITTDLATGVVTIAIVEDAANNKRLKTPGSRRRVPVHPELSRLGFLKFVAERREHGGNDAQLFPLLKVGPNGSRGEAWSHWFGRYIRSIGITNRANVFHSFRHSFKDALRAAAISEDINDALTGHSGGGVGRTYGARDTERRFGLKRLAEAVSAARYEGLKLPG